MPSSRLAFSVNLGSERRKEKRGYLGYMCQILGQIATKVIRHNREHTIQGIRQRHQPHKHELMQVQSCQTPFQAFPRHFYMLPLWLAPSPKYQAMRQNSHRCECAGASPLSGLLITMIGQSRSGICRTIAISFLIPEGCAPFLIFAFRKPIQVCEELNLK